MTWYIINKYIILNLVSQQITIQNFSIFDLKTTLKSLKNIWKMVYDVLKLV